MQPGVLLGVCAGAGTATPALAAIQEAGEERGADARLRRRVRGRQPAARAVGHGDCRADVAADQDLFSQVDAAAASSVRKNSTGAFRKSATANISAKSRHRSSPTIAMRPTASPCWM